MNFRDTLVKCQECGKEYIFTVEKQRQMADQGLEVKAPDLCSACTQKIKYGDRLHGRIKWFSLEKGYGFIAEDSGSEVFFHRNSVQLAEDGELPALDDGLEVLYETSDTPKGPQAIKVTPYEA